MRDFSGGDTCSCCARSLPAACCPSLHRQVVWRTWQASSAAVPLGRPCPWNWPPAGDAQAPLSYPHTAGGSRPDHILLDVGLVPALVRARVDGTRAESDHLPLLAEIQCQPAGQQALPCNGNDGEPLPRLRWDACHREGYVNGLDGRALESCVHLAQHGSLAESCSKLSDTLLRLLWQLAATTNLLPLCRLSCLEGIIGPSLTRSAGISNGCTSILDPGTQNRRMCSGASMASVVRRKCRVYRQHQTGTLLREIRRKPQDFWRKLNGRPAPLPQLLQRQDQWQQHMADLCAPWCLRSHP